jgi:surfeit locus 1 family protein
MSRSLSFIVASAIALVILLSLGVWQLQRLAWKQGLITELQNAASATPTELGTQNDVADYLRLKASGQFLQPPQFMVTSFQGTPGWTVIAGLKVDEQRVLLVELGKIPESARTAFKLPSDTVSVRGQVLHHANQQGMFDPENNETAATWYWWDVPALAATVSGSNNAAVLPFVLHMEPSAALPGGPEPQKLVANLRNNHLGYAITWFGLAGVLIVMSGLFLWRERRRE